MTKKTPSEWAKDGSPYDCTGLIGQLDRPSDEKPEWPMYSYSRPGSILWNAIAKALHNKGWTDEEIREWLQSTNPRHTLDGTLGDKLEALGEKFAETITKNDIPWVKAS